MRFQFDMVNFSFASFTNTTNITRREGDREVPSLAGSIIIIIINTISFPCAVLLNVLVIKAVKTAPRLRTNSNILLACLAVTDALTGLLCQPLFILWRIFLVFGLSNSETAKISFISSLLVTLVSSYLHLMLVTFERLIAIKLPMQYSNIMTEKNMKIAVLVVWIAFIYGILRGMKKVLAARSLTGLFVFSFLLSLTLSCIEKLLAIKTRLKLNIFPRKMWKDFWKRTKHLKQPSLSLVLFLFAFFQLVSFL